MKNICYVLIAVCVLAGCEDTKTSKPINESQKTETPEIVKEATKKKEIKKEKHTFITTENVLDYMIAYGEKNKERKVRIVTDFGNIDLELYNETPYHRANFIMLAKRNYFEGTQFHRVVNDFIIQGGNSDSWSISKKRQQIGQYLLPPDTKKGFKHDRGVISMPSGDIDRTYKLASPFEFFIVQKKGGTHHLNKEYTAFGKVIAGMDVVDEIASQKTDKGEWPKKNIMIRKVEVLD
ncbi:Putative bifunctional phosphatase/peptidyl-prolyl cis-trans isomerase [Kordia antarctica]|uniref:Peptidyl-prolyl cis-trans isomerase n=1 Tax=Kordia antarctica TaxID=1218801 RepID=A0A7L4ZRI1_9FLAO|nr:peptidylprolyl isomerase [Kordia antarctica]QHI39080.1 Putative bifunctional phosphatase/peptidyl-prolyl cis-trans isomerase [Kordia antarctica]